MKLQATGGYFKSTEIKKGDVIKFLDEGTIETSTKYTYEDGSPKKSFVFLVELNGKQGKFRLNKASREACIQAFGDETKKWIGREATCFVMPTPDGIHKMCVLDPIFKEQEWS